MAGTGRHKQNIFVGISASAALRNPAARLAEWLAPQLGEAASGVRWMPPDSQHLTLSFLGMAPPPALLEELARSLNQIMPHHPLTIPLSHARLNARAQRGLIRAVPSEVPDGLARLKRAVDSVARSCGRPVTPRAFVPHITLARIAPVALAPAKRAFERADPQQLNLAPAVLQVSEAILYRSVLAPEGAQHSVVKAYKLTGRRRTTRTDATNTT